MWRRLGKLLYRWIKIEELGGFIGRADLHPTKILSHFSCNTNHSSDTEECLHEA